MPNQRLSYTPSSAGPAARRRHFVIVRTEAFCFFCRSGFNPTSHANTATVVGLKPVLQMQRRSPTVQTTCRLDGNRRQHALCQCKSIAVRAQKCGIVLAKSPASGPVCSRKTSASFTTRRLLAMTQPFRLLPRGYLREDESMSIGVLGDRELKSVYQAIISPALLRTVGMEAKLLVQQGGRVESAETRLASMTEKDIADLDRLALAVHSRNAPPAAHGNEWLFLPIHPHTIRHQLFSPEEALRELAAMEVSPERLVLEVADSASLNDEQLQDFVSRYREAGFRIALDDFGAGA